MSEIGDDARRALAFQVAAQLPGNTEDALFVLALASDLVRFAAGIAPAKPEAQERVPPLRVVPGAGSSF
jgi:hypothetical protein